MTVASTPHRLSKPSHVPHRARGYTYADAGPPTRLLHMGYGLDYLGNDFLFFHNHPFTVGKIFLPTGGGRVKWVTESRCSRLTSPSG